MFRIQGVPAMRLYLSSFRMGNAFSQLVAALPTAARIAVISNAVDFIPTADRLAYARNVFDPIAVFESHGFTAFDLDLRNFFSRADDLRAALDGTALVWAVGGNSFLLRRAMAQSGFDGIVQDRVAAGTLIYGGWSAGAVVATPTLRGIELVDDPNLVVDGYTPEPIWEGLSLVDFSIVPHFRSSHPESEACERAAEWLTEHELPFRTLRDGEAIIV